jgi:hypothetical protein
MPEFKEYLLNEFGRVTAHFVVVADDVEAAMAHAEASALEHAATVEIWAGAEFVGRAASPFSQEYTGPAL